MVDIHPILKQRRSGVAFSSGPLAAEQLEALLEAFRWGPSSRNAQPWRIIVVRTPEAHQKFDAGLSANNQKWATQAPVKMVILGNPEEQPDRNGQSRWLLDVGLALENMLLQGCDLGLTVHAMAGWDEDTILKNFNVPPRSGWQRCSPWAILARSLICRRRCSRKPTRQPCASRSRRSSSGRILAKPVRLSWR